MILVTLSITVCISCQRSSKTEETNKSDTEQETNDNISYTNKKDTTKNINLFSRDIETLKIKVAELDTARNDNYKRLKSMEDSKAINYFYIVAIIACLGLIAFLYVIWLHVTFWRSETENIKSFDEINEKFKDINIKIKRIEQTSSGKVANTSSLSEEIDILKNEIRSIKEIIDSHSYPIMHSQQSQQTILTDTSPKQSNEGYVDDVKGNGDNGYFAADLHSARSNDSCYHIFNIIGKRAEFKAIDFKSVNGHNAATKAVMFSGVERKDATNIEKQEPGVVEKSIDGYWEIITKAQIKLI